jgi:hypothetical protein
MCSTITLPMRDIMIEASRIVLDGFELRTDVETVRYPDRYVDERGVIMWDKVMAFIDEAKAGTVSPVIHPPGGQVLTRSAGSSLILS